MAKKTELDQQITLPKNWKNLSEEEQEKWLNENCTAKPRITTEVRSRKKPHEKFKLKMQVDSTPVELNVEADKTDVKIKDLTPNPYKYSFGKALMPHGVAEACIYLDRNNPQKMPNSVLWFFKKDQFAKRDSIDQNRKLYQKSLRH